jgi:AraC-like DNA-binding protein
LPAPAIASILSQNSGIAVDRAPAAEAEGAAAPVRHQRLWSGAEPGGVSATLTYYAPDWRQAAHAHDYHQLSFLLLGELREESRHGEFDLCGTRTGFKPADLRHSVVFGTQGALLFSLRYDDGLGGGEGPPAGWGPSQDVSGVLSLIGLAVRATADADRADALADLAAIAGELQPPVTAAAAPRWLVEARAAIREAPHAARIDDIALRAGVHRNCIRRSFLRYYRVLPSIYRRRCMAARALPRVFQGADRLTMVAAAAGFADHSHLARTVKDATGLTMSELRLLLA